MPLPDCIRLLRNIVEALAFAHSKGIVHRDVKPENVLLSGGHALVADFGIARAIGEPGDERLTTVGLALGTPAYMAPEQVAGDPRVDHRADIYAAGAVGYEMVAGRRPFERSTRQQVLSAKLTERPDPIASLRPEVPPALARLLMRCLEKEPDARFQRADEVLRAIDDVSRDASMVTHAGWIARVLSRRMTMAAVVLLLAGGAAGARWMWTRDVPAAPAPAPASVDRKSYRIAVLPFDNLSQGDEFFTDGITRDINSRLSRISGFTVIAHGSAERLQHADYPEIAKRLKVDYVIDGSVTRAANRCRILVSLIDPSTETQLWNQEYNREITIANLLEARTDVAANVAQALNLTLTAGERSEPAPTQNFEAYRAYQLGRFYAAKRTVPALNTAREHFERAVKIDPDYALAHAGLADVHVLLPFFDRLTSSRDSLPRAAAAATVALRLDPMLGEAEAALALVREFQFDWKGAETHFQRAIQLSPQYATAHHWYADMLARQRRHDEAQREIRIAVDLDPVSPVINQDVGYVLGHAGKTEEAIQAFRRTVDLDPGFASTWGVLGMALLSQRRFDEARDALKRYAELSKRDSKLMLQLVDAVEAHAQTGVPQPIPDRMLEDSGAAPYAVPAFLVLMGRPDEAITFIERGYAEGRPSAVMAAGSPVFNPLRSNPRFIALLEKAGLPR